jgi:hypothetical protein
LPAPNPLEELTQQRRPARPAGPQRGTRADYHPSYRHASHPGKLWARHYAARTRRLLGAMARWWHRLARRACQRCRG